MRILFLSFLINEEKYQHLSESTRKYYEERLNWDNWAVEVKALLDQHFQSHFPNTLNNVK